MTRKARKVDGNRISAAWRKIIAALARYQSFTRADVATVAKRHGRPFGFARFKRAGIFKRVGPGTYRVAGAKPAGVKTEAAPKPKPRAKAKLRKAPPKKAKPGAVPPAEQGGAS
jgi:hypothetical protein